LISESERMKNNLELLRKKTLELLPQSIDELKTYVHFRSISAQKSSMTDTVRNVSAMIEATGGNVKILENIGANPVVFGYFKAGPNGNTKRTLLFYNHYDVQPPEPLEEWDSDPFTLTIREGKLYARGVSDNKGDLVVRLTAIRLLQSLEGGLPCNIKILVEGEEEIGSRNLEAYITSNPDLFTADACIWEFGEKDQQERAHMVAGVKGMVYLQLSCTGADVDIHSMAGAYIDNPAWRLVQALASLKSAENEILVEGFYDGVIHPSVEERETARRIPFDEEHVKSLYGLKLPLITDAKQQDPREAMMYEPTMTICGIESGYYGEGSKTVLPRKALAKLDCRIVMGQEPEHIANCIERHLVKHGFKDIEVELLNAQRAYRSDLSHPFFSIVVTAAQEVYGTEIVLEPSSAGSGPMYEIGQLLHMPIASTGVGWFDSRYHAPNESIRAQDFEQGIVYIAHLLCEFGKIN
jgi:acetylornithine deacetylase/succinyl-diaminopimelate desuccinylase-like protein